MVDLKEMLQLKLTNILEVLKLILMEFKILVIINLLIYMVD